MWGITDTLFIPNEERDYTITLNGVTSTLAVNMIEWKWGGECLKASLSGPNGIDFDLAYLPINAAYLDMRQFSAPLLVQQFHVKHNSNSNPCFYTLRLLGSPYP
jgi:hypothetical protein